jgi:hypothetical protein
MKHKKPEVKAMISTSNELSIHKKIPKLNASTEFKTFFDGGFFGDNVVFDTAKLLANIGLGATFSSYYLGKELTLRMDLPFITLEDKRLIIDNRNWVFSFQRSF